MDRKLGWCATTAGLLGAVLMVSCTGPTGEPDESGDEVCRGDACEEGDARGRRDSGAPVRDAGDPGRDAGAPVRDAGPSVRDAGPAGGDASTKSDAGRGDGGRDAGDGTHGGSDAGHGGAASGLPCDVAAILDTHCGDCHGATPKFGAPMALASATDFQGSALGGSPMHEVVKRRIEETDPRRAMPPASANPLSAAAKKTLSSWLAAGAPASDAVCTDAPGAGKPAAEVDTSGLECFRMLAHAGDLKTPYAVGVAKDAYFNFVYRAPWQGDAYGVVFRPIIDNSKVIHHWLLFQDGAPGKVGGAVPSTGAHPGGQLLAVWAPGGDTLDLRKNGAEAALELPGNTTYTIEFHYNSEDASAKDASGVEVCIQRKKPKNLAGVSWLGWDQLLLPAKQWTGTCKPKSQEPIHVLAVMPHMHMTGTHMKGTINRANGTKEILHDAPFDFNYQRLYDKQVTIGAGDTITTVCDYAKPMAFGEQTGAEMCYLFTYAYPKGALADNGAWGQLAHGGSACLGQ